MENEKMITIFNSIFKTDTPFHVSLEYVLELIKSEKNKEKIELIRSTKDKEKRSLLKKQLKGICFSGRFSKRNDRSIIDHSGMVCLDYDNVEDIPKLKKQLKKNEYVYSFFVSPSGKGLKVLIKVPASIEDHKAYYVSICEAFNFEGLDEATRDLSRICFESYDPDLYLNEDSLLWEDKKEYEIIKYTDELPKYFQITDKKTRLEVIFGWFDKRFQFVHGEMNNNLCKLATALNKVGIEKTEAKILVMDKYPDIDLSMQKINEIFNWAYEKIEDFGKFILKDSNKIAAAKVLKPEKLKRKMINEGFSKEDIEDVKEFDFKSITSDFWSVTDKGKVILNHFLFKIFLQNNGFWKLVLNEQEYTFVKLQDNVLTDLTGAKKEYIKDFVLKYLQDNEEFDVYNTMAGNSKLFKDDYLNMLDNLELQILEDDKDTSYLYFKNGCVKVTKKGTELIPYIDCGGLVWDNQIMSRAFTPIEDNSCDFKQFVRNISKDDDRRVEAMERTLGYLLHRYKKPSEAYAVVLYDEVNSSNPDGGTGKTLLCNSLMQVRSVATEDGKAWNSGDNFAYQNVNQSHDIFCVDDLKKKFDFEKLFSIVTTGMTINKKNMQPIKIPFADSPKIYLTSNYIIQGDGDSFSRRLIELELFRYYKMGFTPFEDFGKMMFIDWTDEEYNKFYNYMISCLQSYMVKGILRLPLITGRLRKLTESTNNSFVSFMESEVLWSTKTQYNSTELMNLFREDSANEVPKSMNSSSFGSWVNHFLKFKEWEKVGEVRVKGRGLCYNIDFKDNPPEDIKHNTDVFDNSNDLY